MVGADLLGDLADVAHLQAELGHLSGAALDVQGAYPLVAEGFQFGEGGF